MSYFRMGTILATAMVSLEPDRSGNFICDGTADNVEIQAAVTYVAALGGGKVFVARGTYNLDTYIALTSDIKFYGEGVDVTILRLNNGVFTNVIQIWGTVGVHVENVTVRDLTVNANWTNNAYQADELYQNGVKTEYADDILIENVKAYDIPANGFQGRRGQRVTFLNCKAEHIRWHGQQFWVDCNDSMIIDGYTTDVDNVGFTIESCARGLIANCVSTDTVNIGAGLYIDQERGAIVGCVLHAEGTGIVVQDTDVAVISGNLIYSDVSGIMVRTSGGVCTDVDVVGNAIYSMYTEGFCFGIELYGLNDTYHVERVNVIGNVVVGQGEDGGFGIRVLSYVDDSAIKDNMVYNWDTGIEINNANSVSTTVKDNCFLTCTTVIIDNGTDTRLHIKEWLVTFGIGGITLTGDVPLASLANTESAAVGFTCPDGLQQLVRAYLMVLPNATQAAADWDIFSDYGAVGEAPNAHGEADAATTYNVTNNQWFDIELVALGFFANLNIGDRGGIRLLVSTAGHDVSVFGLKFEYV